MVLSPSSWAQPPAESEDGNGSGGGAAMIEPEKRSTDEKSKSSVNWNGLVRDSLIFTGIQHAFRLGTEPGTRSGLKGPFFSGYVDSIENLHGWGDGDPFLVNYVGHPMQGAVSGYFFIRNDSAGRQARFGKDPRYWRSRLKAMGFAFAYSTLFEIGPISEASIGKIQNYRPQQGFVDHVVTPLLGTGWIVAEDFLDEKVILPFERRFTNRYARLMMRSWLNPSRSFSNFIGFHMPWYRDTRGGISDYNYRPPHEMAPEAPREFSKTAFLELTGVPMWTRFDGTQCSGGGGQAAFRLSPSWQFVGQVNGCQLRDLPAHTSGDSLTYAVGPRWSPYADRRFIPYAQVLVGGNKLTRYEVDPVREQVLKAGARQRNLEPPAAETYTTATVRNGVALVAGTGVDIRLNPALALRLASVEYTRSWAAIDSRTYSRGVQFSTGMILRVGTW